MTELQRHIFKRGVVVSIVVLFISMSIAIYVLYGLNISMKKELNDSKTDLSTAIKLLYKCQDVMDKDTLKNKY